MKGKKVLMGLAAATLGAVGGLTPTAVETTQAVANQTTVQQAQAKQSQANQGQQKSVQQRSSQNMLQQRYATPGCGYVYESQPGLTPKAYGIYLAMTGKKKYNDRRRKHWAKMHS